MNIITSNIAQSRNFLNNNFVECRSTFTFSARPQVQVVISDKIEGEY